jgi:ribosomal protein L24E
MHGHTILKCCNVIEEILLNIKLNGYLYICDKKHDNLMISRRRNSVKLSWASSSIECLNGE